MLQKKRNEKNRMYTGQKQRCEYTGERSTIGEECNVEDNAELHDRLRICYMRNELNYQYERLRQPEAECGQASLISLGLSK